MPNKRKEELKKLQAEKEDLILKIKKNSTTEIRKNHNQKIIQIKDQMANLNKLTDKEKNIHAIWIGLIPKGEFDNLKIWAKYNPDYKIHIWTDSTHILTHKLNSAIFNHSKIINNDVKEHNYQFEAKLKDEFYNNYQLKNPKKTFDENVKQFLFDKRYASLTEIINYIKEGQEKIIEEQTNIKKYTPNQVILHDVNEEKNIIFSNEEYYNGYLKTLEHLHLCAGASDRLRYAILNKFGGIYLDTDLSLKFNLKNIKNKNLSNLINSVKWDTINNAFNKLNKKFEIILNQMILLDNLNELNNENLKNFAKKWEKVFKGDSDKNFEIFKAIAKEFKNNNLNLTPNMKLSDFPINNFLGTTAYERNEHNIYNAFIISKANSKLLKDVMKKIKITDEKIKNMDTHKKLINKDMMVLYHTGSAVFYYTIMKNDKNYFYQHNKNSSKVVSLDNINNFVSNWYGNDKYKDIIDNENEIRFLFLDHTKKIKIPNYDDRPEVIQIKKQIENSALTEEEKEKIWCDDSFWFIKSIKRNEIITKNKAKKKSFILNQEI